MPLIFISTLQFSNLYSSTISPSPLLRSDRNSSHHDDKYLEDGIDLSVRPILHNGSVPTPLIDSHSLALKLNDFHTDEESTIYASSLKNNSTSPREATATGTLGSQHKINSKRQTDYYLQGLSGTNSIQSILANASTIADKSDYKNNSSSVMATNDHGHVNKVRNKERKRIHGDPVDSAVKVGKKVARQSSAKFPPTLRNYVNGSTPNDNKSILSHSSIVKGRKATIGSIAMSDQASREGGQNSKVIVIQPKESFFWKGAQTRLCQRLKKERKKDQNLLNSIKSSQHRNESNPVNKLRMELNAPCTLIHEKHMHGNFILGFYGMRLAALAFDTDFDFRCSEKNSKHVSGRKYLLWWLQTDRSRLVINDNDYNGNRKASKGRLSTNRPNDRETSPYSYPINHTLYMPSKPSSKNACSGMSKAALHYTTEYVRRDLRAMATELAPSIEAIDDVAIHFRCGDVLSSKIPKGDTNYGLLKFQAYRRRIPANTKTIGIVTAPFSKPVSLRKEDRAYGDSCQHLVTQLQLYLQRHFPKASIHVRNDPHETIPTVFARLILAKVTFCARSTFCLFPAVAAFGRSYVQRDGVAYFMDRVSEVYENVLLMDEPFLRSYEIGKRGFNSTVHWLIGN